MKLYRLILCGLLLIGLLVACKNGDSAPEVAETSALDTESRLSSDAEAMTEVATEDFSEPATEPISEAEPETEPATEPPTQATTEPPTGNTTPPTRNSSFADAPLIIRVVDSAERPVSNLTGTLELGVETEDTSPPAVGLVGDGESHACTGESGTLYFTESAEMLPKEGTLTLAAYYDSSMQQSVRVDLTSAPREITVTWTGATPPASAPEPSTRRITFVIVDQNEQPVAGISGGLEQTSGEAVHYRGLTGTGAEGMATDESGKLYLELEQGWEDRAASRAYQLTLTGFYDDSLRQEHRVELPDPPATYTITWKLDPPPTERPPQTSGIRLFVVDKEGAPVSGVTLSGSPYPKETRGPVPSIAVVLGPSDEQGYIRWDDVEPGTYALGGSKDNLSQDFEFKMPKNKDMVDITLIWEPTETPE